MSEFLRYLPIYTALLILVALSAFFSGTEIAVSRANRMRINSRAEQGERRAKIALSLIDDFTKTISAILVGNNLVNIAFSSAVTFLAVRVWFKDGFSSFEETAVNIAMTVIILIFGETAPKMICAENADRFTLFAAMPMKAVSFVFGPVIKAVTAAVNALSRLWTPKDTLPTATPEELCTMVEEIADEGVLTTKEEELIKSAIEFTETTAREVMIPRVDVAAFDIDSPAEELKKNSDLLSFARFPVYSGSIDNVIGILSSKMFIRESVIKGDVDIRDLLIKPLYVHMTRTVSSILDEFRKKHCQMAIVVDEYGGTMGILTLEDIVEEIVGDIFDETDDVEKDLVRHGDSFEVDGGMTVDDLFDALGFQDEEFESEYTTVGGWATEMLDKFPEAGDSFDYKTLHVSVISAEDRRVDKLLVTMDEKEE